MLSGFDSLLVAIDSSELHDTHRGEIIHSSTEVRKQREKNIYHQYTFICLAWQALNINAL